MKQIYTDVIQFRGSHYDLGYIQGQKLKNSFLVQNRNRQWKVRIPRFRIDENAAKTIFRRFNSSIWDEMEGLRDALGWPMERVLLEFGGYRLKLQQSGCSIFVGKDYMIRNYDYHPKTYDGRYVVYQPTDHGYATIGVSQRVSGRSDGMNEKGLTLGYTFINRKRPGDGFVCHMVGRLILELCANVEEAVSLLKELPHRGSFSYILFDGKSNMASIVETSPRGVQVRQGNTCTNHFEMMTKENRHFLDDSNKRLHAMNNKQNHDLSGLEAFRMLNDSDQELFSNQYRNWAGTIHTSAYFPQSLASWLALGGDQKPTEFDFAEWLAGTDFSNVRIEGKVDTDIPFLHMEKADWFKN
ncbi:C45 family autoproteolytic acyltransferase/hydolase [Gracilibacillus thailandensis]|uniref:Acyl-CoA--6-aminopenicillanic acid acyltransferase n=1 Tax=Gracilibacillus thailandensis TaxID=563735 RepID=A0A6N7QZH8_9BACI|nr:C45 family peptidase [Gracilibacillus thailandensis]MRI65309.1 acyl-CoA--6-aminopenicillanic acid acyltransferase [Gracilibacillus thailandensis]